VRAVVQRVSEARVTVEDEEVARIGPGLVVLVAVGAHDTEQDCCYLARKVVGLRIFDGPEGKMNLSVGDVGGSALVVSEFTLYGDCRKGRRPSFTGAAAPQKAQALYLQFADEVRALGVPVLRGRFGASMRLSLVNDGPVTLLLDSHKAF